MVSLPIQRFGVAYKGVEIGHSLINLDSPVYFMQIGATELGFTINRMIR